MPHQNFHLAEISRSGIGLRAPHMRELLDQHADVGFLEAHTENYFGGGVIRKQIRQIANTYPVSLHGVGLSLGRADGLDQDHIRQVKALVEEINPVFVSEHLAWSAYRHIYVPDLLPLPYTHEALDVFVRHVEEFQELVGQQILIENPSNYIAFEHLDYTEPEFLSTLARRSGCGLLLDINNIAVSAHNLGLDPRAYIDAISVSDSVKQFHLAGYQVNQLETGEDIRIDTHGESVHPDVWGLYEYALAQLGDQPTLIEWDTDIPSLDILLAEAAKADVIRSRVKEGSHAHTA